MRKPPKPGAQPSLFEAEPSQPIDRPFALPNIFLGTSSFTASGWKGSFYPPGMRLKDYLRHYASQFQTAEVDSTFYSTPSPSTVTGWNEKTPGDFIFAVKVQVITHEKVLVDCEPEFDEFIGRMHLLGDKLAVEVRNKAWLDGRLTDLLREHNVGLALTDTSFMPRPWEMKGALDLITADFAYVRWLGNRKGIEQQTVTWVKTVVDRQDDLKSWVVVLKRLVLDKRIRKLFALRIITMPGMHRRR